MKDSTHGPIKPALLKQSKPIDLLKALLRGGGPKKHIHSCFKEQLGFKEEYYRGK